MDVIVNWTAVGTVARIISTLAVVLSVVYLARQVEVSNRLARAEASRTPNSDLNALNASFGTDPVFRPAMQTSWSLYRRCFSSGFVGQFEKQFGLDPALESVW